MAPEKKPPTPEEAAHIEELQKEFVAATGTGPAEVKPPRAKAAPATPTAKAAKAKDTATRCRFGEGRYYSKPADPWCPLERAKGKQLCAAHEKVMSAAKAAGTAKVGSPRVSPVQMAKAAKVVAKGGASGGAKRTSKPPVPEMHSGVVIPRVTVAQPAMTMMVAPDGGE